MKRTEDNIQKACVYWFKLQYPHIVIHHSPNGGFRTQAEGGIFKAMGTLAGFPDLFIMHAAKDYHGLFVEMKSKKGRHEDSQKAFEKKATESGYKYIICRSIDQFINEINNYLK